MSNHVKTGMNASVLKAPFKAWQIPNDQEFARLIDVASQSFNPGYGLEGGDPSPLGSFDGPQTTALSVHAKPAGGMTASAEGVTLNVKSTDPDGIILADKKPIALNVQANKGLKADKDGLSVVVNHDMGLVIASNAVSLNVDPTSGLVLEGEKLRLNVDKQSLMTDDKRVFVHCKPQGGLTIDENGCLLVDIKTILAAN